MNTLLILGLQVTLVALVGIAVSLTTRKWMSTSGTLPLGATLGAVVLLTACAFSSWPSWLGRSDSRTGNPEVHDPASVSSDPYLNPYVEHLVTVSTPLGTFDIPTWAEPYLFVAPSRDASVLPDSSASDVPSSAPSINWIWLLVGAAILIGLIRVIGGLWAVRLFVRTSRPLKSQSLLEQVDLLRAEMGCAKSVEVRECPQMATAATVGWRRPVVLLSDSWQSWTPDQLRSVLAHEIAHITRGDFLATVAAQVGVVLHFYHPLVHWLANRLRLEQELAADALAAKVVGGSRAYLNAIGELALKQSNEPVGWPAHSFLPTRRTFLRRIEMLRDLKFLSGGNSRLAKWATLTSVVAVTLVAIGLRPPVGDAAPSRLQAAQPLTAALAVTQTTTAQTPVAALEAKYVPADALAVAVVRPGALSQQFQKLKATKLISEEMPNPLDKFQQCESICSILVLPQEGVMSPDRSIGLCMTFENIAARDLMLKTMEPVSINVRNGLTWQKRKLLLLEYEVLAGPGGDGGPQECRYVADERTILFAGSPEVMERMFLTGAKSLSPLTQSDSWKAATQGAVAMAVDAVGLQKVMATVPSNPILGLFSPLWTSAVSHTFCLNLGEKAQVSLTAQAKDAANSKQLEGTLKAGIAMLSGMLNQAQSSPDPKIKSTVEGLLPIIGGHTLTTMGNLTTLTCEADLSVVATLLAPPISQARAAAQRAQQQNNMKQIMLALHMYHDLHGHFPPAVVIDPASGVARSWRVEILPYIEGDSLHKQYQSNEPWDSENNKKVLAQMPRVFRHPAQAADSTVTSISAAFGKGLIFEEKDKDGTALTEIIDGTSNTIAIVEVQSNIPWTRPEEVGIDLTRDKLPDFGGFAEGVFHVGLADGSVRTISKMIDLKTLKAMFTKAGQEVVDFNFPVPTGKNSGSQTPPKASDPVLR